MKTSRIHKKMNKKLKKCFCWDTQKISKFQQNSFKISILLKKLSLLPKKKNQSKN